MGLKEFRQKLEDRKKERIKKKSESKAFKEIVDKRNLQARREAFAEESKKVAGEKGKALARKKSFGELVSERVGGGLRAKVSGTRTPVRRVSKAPVRRAAKKKVRRIVKSVKKKKVARRKSVRKVRAKTRKIQPKKESSNSFRIQSLNEAIYG